MWEAALLKEVSVVALKTLSCNHIDCVSLIRIQNSSRLYATRPKSNRLEVGTSDPLVDGINHTLSLNSRVGNASNNSHHGQTSIHKLSMGGNAHSPQIGQNSTKLGVSLHLPFIHWVVRIQEESV